MDAPWLELLNSDCHDYLGRGQDEDRLENPDWLERFLGRWSLHVTERSRDDSVSALRALRTLIRDMADRVLEGGNIREPQWSRLNGVLAGAGVVRRIEQTDGVFAIDLVPLTDGIERVLAEIAVSFADVFVRGDPSRIKLCENADCRWVIYDESRNRSRRWCAGGTGCGNLMKVRRHRARRRAAKPRPGRES